MALESTSVASNTVLIATGSAVALATVAKALGPFWQKRIDAEVLKEQERLRAAVAQGSPIVSTSDSIADASFGALLSEYYAFGLVQARRSFAVSLACSALGGLALACGVVMAFLETNSSGVNYVSIVTSLSGVLTGGIGTLFHRRADLALKHMTEQSKLLRQDMRSERDAAQAIKLLREVQDEALQSRLQAALILKFSSAKLPELGSSSQDQYRKQLPFPDDAPNS